MSVKVTSFTGPMLDYFHDDCPEPHGGQLDQSTLHYDVDFFGEPNYNTVVVPCPEDSDISYWPAGGGADKRLGQMLHLKMALQTLPRVDAVNVLKGRIAASIDGPDRYCLTEADIDEVVNGN